jgi:hypothetical protein
MSIQKAYWALNAIIILAGIYLFFDVLQEVSLGTVVSFSICLVAPFTAAVIYILAILWRYFFGLDTIGADADDNKKLYFPKYTFILSGISLVLYANPDTRNAGEAFEYIWIASLFGGVGLGFGVLQLWSVREKFGWV